MENKSMTIEDIEKYLIKIIVSNELRTYLLDKIKHVKNIVDDEILDVTVNSYNIAGRDDILYVFFSKLFVVIKLFAYENKFNKTYTNNINYYNYINNIDSIYTFLIDESITENELKYYIKQSLSIEVTFKIETGKYHNIFTLKTQEIEQENTHFLKIVKNILIPNIKRRV